MANWFVYFTDIFILLASIFDIRIKTSTKKIRSASAHFIKFTNLIIIYIKGIDNDRNTEKPYTVFEISYHWALRYNTESDYGSKLKILHLYKCKQTTEKKRLLKNSLCRYTIQANSRLRGIWSCWDWQLIASSGFKSMQKERYNQNQESHEYYKNPWRCALRYFYLANKTVLHFIYVLYISIFEYNNFVWCHKLITDLKD